MSRVRYVTTLLALVGLVCLASDATGQAKSLTGILEQAWHRYLAASRSGNEAELRAAALLYVRDSDTVDSTGRPRVDCYFMKFLEEDGVWKMDAYQRVNVLRFKPDGSLAGFDPNHIQPTYEIDRRVLPPPALLPATR